MRSKEEIRDRCDRQRGVSLVEFAVASFILTIASLSMIYVAVLSSREHQNSKEIELANNAAREIIEEMKSRTFTELYPAYGPTAQATPANWIMDPKQPLVMKRNGAHFLVPGLTAQAGAFQSFQGEIFFYVDETANTAGSVEVLRFNFPRDLDGDGAATNAAVTTGYLLLPARILVRWFGIYGDTEKEFLTVLASN